MTDEIRTGFISMAEVSDEAVEAHIRSLRWSADATNLERTLTAGNIRGFAAKLRRCPCRTAVHGRCELERGHAGQHVNALGQPFSCVTAPSDVDDTHQFIGESCVNCGIPQFLAGGYVVKGRCLKANAPAQAPFDLEPAKRRITELAANGASHIRALLATEQPTEFRHLEGPDPFCDHCDDIFGEANLLRELVTEIERLQAGRLVDPSPPEITDPVEAAALIRGLADVKAGRVRPLSDIRAELEMDARTPEWKETAGNLSTKLQDAIAPARVDPAPQPPDPQGRFLLNAYGQQCWDFGFQAAEIATATTIELRDAYEEGFRAGQSAMRATAVGHCSYGLEAYWEKSATKRQAARVDPSPLAQLEPDATLGDFTGPLNSREHVLHRRCQRAESDVARLQRREVAAQNEVYRLTQMWTTEVSHRESRNLRIRELEAALRAALLSPQEPSV